MKILFPDASIPSIVNVANCIKFSNKSISLYALNTLQGKNEAEYSSHIDTVITIKADTEAAHLSALINTIEQHKIDLVLPTAVKDISFVSKHINKISQYTKVVNLPDIELLEKVDDKWLFARLMMKHEIAHPHSQLLSEVEANKATFPLLVKPRIGTGGANIEVLNNINEFNQYIKNKAHQLEEIIAQEYIPGYDIDASVLCDNGEVKTFTIQRNKICKRNPFQPPRAIEFIKDEQAEKLFTKMLQTINFNGVCHIDMRMNEKTGEMKIIEINPRYWASLYGSIAAGVDFPMKAIELAQTGNTSKSDYKTITFTRLSYWFKNIFKKDIHLRNTNFKFLMRDIKPTLQRKFNLWFKKKPKAA